MDNDSLIRDFKKWQRKRLAIHSIAAIVMVYALWRLVK